MINVVGYIRVSTMGQVKEGYSLGEQLDEIEKFCTANGFNLVATFRDESIILGLGQEVLVPQGFPGLVLIFMRLRICGPSRRMIEKCVELSPSPIRRAA